MADDIVQFMTNLGYVGGNLEIEIENIKSALHIDLVQTIFDGIVHSRYQSA